MSKKKKSVRFFSIHPDEEKAQIGLSIFNVFKSEVETSLPLREISLKAGISYGTASEYVNLCGKSGFLKISGSGQDELVSFNDSLGKILGVGFKGDRSFLTVMDLSGKVITRAQVGVRHLSELKGRNKEIKGIIEEIKNGMEALGTGFYSAGIALPEELTGKNPRSMDILADGIGRLFDCDVLVTGEATAAGYGERDCGDRSRGRDVLYMHLDIGTGVVIKREMIFEADDSSNGEDKAYLRPWRQFSIVSTAKSLVNKGVGTSIVNMVGGDVNGITLEIVLGAAKDHDELAEDLVRRSGLALGVRTAYLANMFNPAVVILGGGTEREQSNFIQFVKESAKRFLMKKLVDKLEVVPGVLGAEASSIGAASLCRRELFMEV
ncbi:MAG: hypothetical protein DRP85_04250 [Candidatus Makaraimicrobium thalassicum]|nr:MAG: hypothetical protein DRP85_04250 [Candidatus Omnitrophota bacterium]